jgi:hypothetical protein
MKFAANVNNVELDLAFLPHRSGAVPETASARPASRRG